MYRGVNGDKMVKKILLLGALAGGGLVALGGCIVAAIFLLI